MIAVKCRLKLLHQFIPKGFQISRILKCPSHTKGIRVRAALQVFLWFQGDMADYWRVQPLKGFQLLILCVQQAERSIKVFPQDENKLFASALFIFRSSAPFSYTANKKIRPSQTSQRFWRYWWGRVIFNRLAYALDLVLNGETFGHIIHQHNVSALLPFLSPQCLFLHRNPECAPGPTPEPCYAAAPNKAICCCCRFNTSQDIPCLYTWIIDCDSPRCLLPSHIHFSPLVPLTTWCAE